VHGYGSSPYDDLRYVDTALCVDKYCGLDSFQAHHGQEEVRASNSNVRQLILGTLRIITTHATTSYSIRETCARRGYMFLWSILSINE
jgi:hypothetical protein